MAKHPVRRAFGLAIAFGVLFFGVAYLVGSLRPSPGSWVSDSTVGVVTLYGEITESTDFVDSVRAAGQDASVAAVVIRIDSPGGQVAPSQEMYAALRELSELKPTVASLGSVAASGGYYVAAAADTVMANSGSLTGSIGVILSLTNLSGLMEKIGVESEVLTGGDLKDMGSPFRPLSSRERAIFQAMADEIHEQFINDVKAVRPLTPDQIAEVSTGRSFTGEEAMVVGLVDQIGGFQDAITRAANLAQIEGEPTVVHFSVSDGPWWLRALLQQSSTAVPPRGAAAFLRALEEVALQARGTLLLRLPLLTDGFRA